MLPVSSFIPEPTPIVVLKDPEVDGAVAPAPSKVDHVVMQSGTNAATPCRRSDVQASQTQAGGYRVVARQGGDAGDGAVDSFDEDVGIVVFDQRTPTLFQLDRRWSDGISREDSGVRKRRGFGVNIRNDGRVVSPGRLDGHQTIS